MEQGQKQKMRPVAIAVTDTLLLLIYQFVSFCFRFSFQRNVPWSFVLHLIDLIVIDRYYYEIKSQLFRKRTKFTIVPEILWLIAIWLGGYFIFKSIVKYIGYFDIAFVPAN